MVVGGRLYIPRHTPCYIYNLSVLSSFLLVPFSLLCFETREQLYKLGRQAAHFIGDFGNRPAESPCNLIKTRKCSLKWLGIKNAEKKERDAIAYKGKNETRKKHRNFDQKGGGFEVAVNMVRHMFGTL